MGARIELEDHRAANVSGCDLVRRGHQGRATLALVAGLLMLVCAISPPSEAGAASPCSEAATPSSAIWIDSTTGALFDRPGPGRAQLAVAQGRGGSCGARPAAAAPAADGEPAGEHFGDTLQDEIEQLQGEQAALQIELEQQRPLWISFRDLFGRKFRLGAQVFMDYGMYTHTGYGPRFNDMLTRPGPGNNLFNSFDISRTYLNFFFTPEDGWLVRITPNISRVTGVAEAASQSRTSAFGSNLTGTAMRIRYAFIQYDRILAVIEPLKESRIVFGSISNPLYNWENDLYGFSYVNRVPWNLIGLPSAQLGLDLDAPYRRDGRTYVDVETGVFNNGSFHSFERTSTKQVMGRVSIYPLGARYRFDGLGFTGFYDYGYRNVAQDVTAPFVPYSSARRGYRMRLALLVHYSSKNWALAGEYDAGHNALGSRTLFSGAGPPQAFRLGPRVGSDPQYVYSTLTTALQNNGDAVQRGFAFFGHYHLSDTPLTLFGMFDWVQPSVRASTNPNDFQYWVGGIEYRANKYVRVAFDSQNLLFYHSQQGFSLIEARSFRPRPFGGTGPRAIAQAELVDMVPRDTHAFFLNLAVEY